jgi:hypothetical protein
MDQTSDSSIALVKPVFKHNHTTKKVSRSGKIPYRASLTYRAERAHVVAKEAAWSEVEKGDKSCKRRVESYRITHQYFWLQTH